MTIDRETLTQYVVTYREKNQERHYTLDIEPGECLWLIGGSGAGKTTIAQAALGLGDGCRAWGGRVGGEDLRAGILFQEARMISELNVLENLALARYQAGDVSREAAPLHELLLQVGLDPHRHGAKLPRELSVGMRRRAALAQSLAYGSEVLVLDEPFAGLDEDTARGIAGLLVEIRGHPGEPGARALILICHELALGFALSSRFVDVEATAQEVPTRPIEGHPEYGDRGVDLPELVQQATAAQGRPPTSPSTAPLRVFDRRWRLSGLRGRIARSLGPRVAWCLLAIVVTFLASGYAISKQFAGILSDADVELLSREFADENAGYFERKWERFKAAQIKKFVDMHAPKAKRQVYVAGLAEALTTELCPLLVALLLAGLLGGWHSGRVAAMQERDESLLLRSLGADPRSWTLLPAGVTALVLALVMTPVATAVALLMGQVVASDSGLVAYAVPYWRSVWEVLTEGPWPQSAWFKLLMKSLAFTGIILVTSEFVARHVHREGHRRAGRIGIGVRRAPSVSRAITKAVVLSCVLVIVADVVFVLVVW